jgi:two-component system, cell cycle response regulator DivK
MEQGYHMGTILIIEDDEATAQLIASVLRSLDHDLLFAVNATQALALVQENELSLILLDMRMPGMKGWELAPILRDEPNASHIPIIAVSVQIDVSDPKRALEVGCDDYIAKPFNINHLRDCVKHHLT